MDLCEFDDSLFYKVSARTYRIFKLRNPGGKRKKKKKKRKEKRKRKIKIFLPFLVSIEGGTHLFLIVMISKDKIKIQYYN